ncbi:Uncharacterised protein [Pseudomonas fluorescens]|uniref:Uncharacterized protein n=1 Tax=Pseudomonas fluorescens TaxID=294 RepID=A0A379IFT1_PSEFL|nr:Uncharacterised protein [Pseudomonas fluorescens]
MDQSGCHTCRFLHRGTRRESGPMRKQAFGEIIRSRCLECVLPGEKLCSLDFAPLLHKHVLSLGIEPSALLAIVAGGCKKGLRQAGSLSSKRR